MRTLILALTLTLSLSVTPAHASGGRMHAIRLIAVQEFGPDVCGDTMAIPVVRAVLQPNRVGEADFADCLIRLRVGYHFTSFYLCLVWNHEVVHLAGWLAPPGEEYVNPDGTLDPYHSNDPDSLMWPLNLSYQPFCAQFIPRMHLSHEFVGKT